MTSNGTFDLHDGDDQVAHILKRATNRSLVLLDEIGRGTSTFDGLSIAWSVTEDICSRIGARTMFATHYHQLIGLRKKSTACATFTFKSLTPTVNSGSSTASPTTVRRFVRCSGGGPRLLERRGTSHRPACIEQQAGGARAGNKAPRNQGPLAKPV